MRRGTRRFRRMLRRGYNPCGCWVCEGRPRSMRASDLRRLGGDRGLRNDVRWWDDA